jgi:hypothetical protein
MASPTRRDVHVNRPLSNLSVAYRNTMYIARDVFPVVSVPNQTDVYFTFDKAAWFRNRSAARAVGTRAQRADYGISTASFICVNDALAKPIPDEVRNNADAPLKPDITATTFVSDALELGLELKVATKITACGNWSSASNPSVKWSSDTSNPWGDIDTAVDKVRATIGRHPNTMVLSWSAWKALRNHPDFLDRVKYTRQGGRVEPTDLQTWFGVDKVLLGGGIYDSAQEGATSSLADIWGDMLWTGWVAPAAAIEEPSAGYVFMWKDRTIARYREEEEHQDIVEGEWFYATNICASDAGAIFSDVT